MFKTLGIVEVSDQTSSLLARRFGNHSLLEWVVRRVTDAQRLDGVIVLCGTGSRETVSSQLPTDVRLFASSASDALGRLADTIREIPAEALVLVSLKHPFVDPVLIDGLIGAAESSRNVDYASYRCTDGRPALLSQVGVFADWCRSAAVLTADENATDAQDRESATRYLYSHPELFQLRLVPVPVPLDRNDVRLGIDVEEDWEHAHEILEALGLDRLDWQRISALLEQQPDIRQRMAVLNHSNADGGR